MDFKATALEHCNQEVIVFFKKGSHSFKEYGPFIEGVFTGVMWKETFEELNKSSGCVTSIFLLKKGKEFMIPYQDVESIEKEIPL